MTSLLLIGGRSGVGKTTVGWEVSALLRTTGVSHAIIEGDFMGQVHPAPPDDPSRSVITERNLTDVWANYFALGCRRLIYTNTLCVLSSEEAMFRRALGADVRIVRVLLTASDGTARERLIKREKGSELEDGLASSMTKARVLDAGTPGDAVRVTTDGRLVGDLAKEIVAATGW